MVRVDNSMNTARTPQRHDIWVFHSGALGDFVLIWPLLRAMSRAGDSVMLVARHSHAALARDWLDENISTRAIEHPDFDALWRGEPFHAPVEEAREVVSFVADDSTPAGRAWMEVTGRSLRARAVRSAGHPGSSTRDDVWRLFHVEQFGSVALRTNTGGAVVLHVGAGSRVKAWPLDRWRQLQQALEADGVRTVVIAGEVEFERFSDAQRDQFAAMSGVFVSTLDDLARTLSTARGVIACDTGPAHLSAQLGVATLALFGATDARVWSPVGPRVGVVAPESDEQGGDMSWLLPERVVKRAREFMIL